MRATVEAIERDLLIDGFVQRYRTGNVDDGFPPGEGAFLACSFWLADAYYLLGRTDEAEQLFERLLGCVTMWDCSPRNMIQRQSVC